MAIQLGNQHYSLLQVFIPYPHADFKHLSEEGKQSLKGLQSRSIHSNCSKAQVGVVSITYFNLNWIQLQNNCVWQKMEVNVSCVGQTQKSLNIRN